MATLKKEWIGPLFQAKEGKQPWVCDYTCPLSGKRKRQRIADAAANKKKREEEYHDFRISLSDGKRLTKANATVNDACDAYEKSVVERNRVKDRMEDGTLYRIQCNLNKHIRPDLGPMLLSKLDSPMIRTYVYGKCKKYKTTGHQLFTDIQQMLKEAVWQGMLLISPLDVKKVRLPQRPNIERRRPTIEEGRNFWHALEREGEVNARIPRHAHINRMATTALAMFGGMCAGEMAGLQWEEVNFIEGFIYIKHSQARRGGLKGPKTDARIRFVVMSAEMNRWMGEVAKRDGYPGTGYVFNGDPNMAGARWGADYNPNHLLRSMTSQLQEAQIRLGFVDENGKALWCMHALRHYAGSVWLELGYLMQDVSRMLGHGKIATTQKYYQYYFIKQNLERDRELMRKVSHLHQPQLPSPAMRDLCEIDGEVTEE
jgi:integrase